MFQINFVFVFQHFRQGYVASGYPFLSQILGILFPRYFFIVTVLYYDHSIHLCPDGPVRIWWTVKWWGIFYCYSKIQLRVSQKLQWLSQWGRQFSKLKQCNAIGIKFENINFFHQGWFTNNSFSGNMVGRVSYCDNSFLTPVEFHTYLFFFTPI